MDEQTQLPASEARLAAGAIPSSAAELSSEAALVPSALSADLEEDVEKGLRLNARVAGLPVELDVAIPVRGFRVRGLLVLEAGQMIQTQWQQGEDMPLAAGDTQLAWSEFEVIDSRLAVRVTRLA
jgi:flagellar motor switch protein FliN/FliY